MLRSDEFFAPSHLGDGTFVLAIGYGSVVGEIEHARLLAECRAHTTGKFRKVIGVVEPTISLAPVALIEGIVPLRVFVAQWACPVAEWHAAVHASRSLFAAVVNIKSLFHFAEVFHAVVKRTVAGFHAWHSKKCFRISHNYVAFVWFTIK